LPLNVAFTRKFLGDKRQNVAIPREYQKILGRAGISPRVLLRALATKTGTPLSIAVTGRSGVSGWFGGE